MYNPREGERAHDGSVEAEGAHCASTNEGAGHVMYWQLIAEAQHMYGTSEAMLNYRLWKSGAYTRYQRAGIH